VNVKKKIQVLIADDSVVYRSQIRSAISSEDWLEVIGSVSNGRLAIERMKCQFPDLLILDMEMPELNGLQTLQEMQKNNLKCPTIVFSSITKLAAERTMEALRLGAIDYIDKPGAPTQNLDHPGDDQSATVTDPALKIKHKLLPKIEAIFLHKLREKIKTSPHSLEPGVPQAKVSIEKFNPQIVIIGSSTGGPTVLENIFSELKHEVSCPIVIAQHMPPIFTTSFAERLAKISGLVAKEASHNEVLKNNTLYLAPGDYHLTVVKEKDLLIAKLDQTQKINSVRPAVDPLFSSVAKIFGPDCLAIVLTGMGEDGKVGAQAVKKAGGVVLIQNSESCVVFGMPGAVMNCGAYDKILTPSEIVQFLVNKVGLKTKDSILKIKTG
jgi:two-component system chemotaxis response regulator CheB